MSTWQNECFGKMDDHLVHTIPNHNPPKWMFCQKLFLKSSLLQNIYSASFKYVPQTTVTTFAFSSICFFFYGTEANLKSHSGSVGTELLIPKNNTASLAAEQVANLC